ncbi:unnamed protein product [Fraxinus pennsylvanica]|uniref:eIF3a PCI domain-containing protein n=1 Tax=Fraxinus pennsylvanica TaxID=56036 RepID=A0AAD2E9S9_9LAMI|nr:unnamed protein product [Fraxinus pennsylvanica]
MNSENGLPLKCRRTTLSCSSHCHRLRHNKFYLSLIPLSLDNQQILLLVAVQAFDDCTPCLPVLDQRDRPDLAAPESLQLYLDTRFEQLKIATELKPWQEAFRSIEDIHGLMCMVKKTPKPSLMVVYYAKQSEIFWISSNHLYHAYYWLKLFSSLQKSFNKNLSQKDLQQITTSIVLATLSVPPYD